MQAATGSNLKQNGGTAASNECAGAKKEPVKVRIYLNPDGTVRKIEPIDALVADPCWAASYETAKRAIIKASPLKLPPGKTYDSLTLTFRPDQIVQ
jgi:hypothetical protein